jgi:hypothetical protein
MQVRDEDGKRASHGTMIVLNENMEVVLWLAVNSTSPSHVKRPMQALVQRCREKVCIVVPYMLPRDQRC